MRHRGAWRVVLLAIVAAGLGACGGDDADALSEKAALGERIFHDRTLSASGKQACSTCHVDAAGHAQDNALAAQLGGARSGGLQGSYGVDAGFAKALEGTGPRRVVGNHA